MLEFDSAKRPTIQTWEENWRALALEFGQVGLDRPMEGKWEKIQTQLRAAERKELSITPKQIERIIAEFETDESLKLDEGKRNDVKGLIKIVKELVS